LANITLALMVVSKIEDGMVKLTTMLLKKKSFPVIIFEIHTVHSFFSQDSFDPK